MRCSQLAISCSAFLTPILAYPGNVLQPYHWHFDGSSISGGASLVETPEANLSRAMQWFNVSYSVCFNRRSRRVGHLFQQLNWVNGREGWITRRWDRR